MLNSCAALAIERPERYAKQLAAHISHKAEASSESDGVTTITFGFGASGTISVNSDSVLLSAQSETQEGLERAQDVLGRHLLKFAKLDDQQITWSD
jgi:hypothetical protein